MQWDPFLFFGCSKAVLLKRKKEKTAVVGPEESGEIALETSVDGELQGLKPMENNFPVVGRIGLFHFCSACGELGFEIEFE